MNTRQAHKLWGISCRTISKYCKEGFIKGAKKEKNMWVIPDNALKPYYFNPDKAKHQLGRKALILQAISQELTIPDEKLSVIPDRINVLFDELVRQGLIRLVVNNSAIDRFQAHILTPDGEKLLEQNNNFDKLLNVLSALPIPPVHLHMQ